MKVSSRWCGGLILLLAESLIVCLLTVASGSGPGRRLQFEIFGKITDAIPPPANG
jgi:hypothetical protein